MPKITAYKCDECGKIQEDEIPFTIDFRWLHDNSPKEDFGLTFYPPGTSDFGACSRKCVIDAFTAWLDERIREKELEDAAARAIKDLPVKEVATALMRDHVDLVEVAKNIVSPINYAESKRG